jgi:hypothetical protein
MCVFELSGRVESIPSLGSGTFAVDGLLRHGANAERTAPPCAR